MTSDSSGERELPANEQQPTEEQREQLKRSPEEEQKVRERSKRTVNKLWESFSKLLPKGWHSYVVFLQEDEDFLFTRGDIPTDNLDSILHFLASQTSERKLASAKSVEQAFPPGAEDAVEEEKAVQQYPRLTIVRTDEARDAIRRVADQVNRATRDRGGR